MKTYTKYLVAGVLVVAVIVISIMFGNKPNNSSSIKIGLVGPFTGKAASFGDFMMRGLDLAEKDLDADDVAHLKIIKEDDVCGGKDSVSAVKKLIEVDRVNYVIGPLCNEASLATERLFEDNKVVSLTVGLPSNKIANMGPYHFSFAPEIELLVKKVASYMTDKNLKRVAIIHMSAAFEDENYTNFVRHYKDFGGIVVSDQAVNKGVTDFRDAVLKIKNANPDSLMLIAYGSDLNIILRQLHDAGISNLPEFSIHAAQSPVLVQSIDLAEGLIYPYPSDSRESESATHYAKMYQDAYGTSPDPSSMNVYDGVHILNTFIKQCGYENRECVRNKLATLKDYPGANGNVTVDERGVGTYREIMLKTVKDGTFVKL